MRPAQGPSESPIRACLEQYNPASLFYSTGSAWDYLPAGRVARHLQSLLPTAELKEGLRAVTQRGPIPSGQARQASAFAHWVHTHGASLGLRIPSIMERSRAVGMESYLAGLRIHPHSLYNAQSETCDRTMIGTRLGRGVLQWLHGDSLPTHGFPDPGTVMTTYRELCQHVASIPGTSVADITQNPVTAQLFPGPNPGNDTVIPHATEDGRGLR